MRDKVRLFDHRSDFRELPMVMQLLKKNLGAFFDVHNIVACKRVTIS
jgi:hypothetical protein